MITPGIDPAPATITTANSGAIKSCPIVGDRLKTGADKTPARPASPALTPKTSDGDGPEALCRPKMRHATPQASRPNRITKIRPTGTCMNPMFTKPRSGAGS